jgi:hypothetical protein
MKDLLNDGELVASSLRFGKSNAIAVDGGIDIDLGPTENNDDYRKSKSNAGAGSRSEHSATFAISSGKTDSDHVYAPEKKASSLSAKASKTSTTQLTVHRTLVDIGASEDNSDEETQVSLV